MHVESASNESSRYFSLLSLRPRFGLYLDRHDLDLCGHCTWYGAAIVGGILILIAEPFDHDQARVHRSRRRPQHRAVHTASAGSLSG